MILFFFQKEPILVHSGAACIEHRSDPLIISKISENSFETWDKCGIYKHLNYMTCSNLLKNLCWNYLQHDYYNKVFHFSLEIYQFQLDYHIEHIWRVFFCQWNRNFEQTSKKNSTWNVQDASSLQEQLLLDQWFQFDRTDNVDQLRLELFDFGYSLEDQNRPWQKEFHRFLEYWTHSISIYVQ